MIPYISTTKPMTGEEQELLSRILERGNWNTPGDRLRLANAIIRAGFHRTVPRKVTKVQLWSYAIETALLLVCAVLLADTDQLFVWGVLTALTFGSAATFGGALVINHGIKKGTLT